MIIISHRGNLMGPEIEKENSPKFIQKALDTGFHVEVDVWYINNSFFLGHDAPTYSIQPSFLKNDNLWCHAKNIDALVYLNARGKRVFYHTHEDVVMTSKGELWAEPGKGFAGSYIVLPEKTGEIIPKGALGICTDYAIRYKEIYK